MMPPTLPAPDFKTLLEAMPGLFLVLDAELRFVAVSEAFVRTTKLRREDILGKSLFEVFPQDSTDPTATNVRELEASLKRVLANRRGDVMSFRDFRIRKSGSQQDGFQAHSWRPYSYPVLANDGSVAWIILRIIDSTDLMQATTSNVVPFREMLGEKSARLEAETFARHAKELAEANARLEQSQQKAEQVNSELQRELTEHQRAGRERTLLSDAIAKLDEGVVITDAELDSPGPRIQFVNEAFCRITGYSTEELIGNTPRMLQGQQTDRATLDRLKSELAAGLSFVGEVVNYRKDGTPYDVELIITPLFEAQGRRTNFISIHRDITDREQVECALRGSEVHFRTLFEQAIDGIFITDAQGRLLDANSAGCEMTGYSRDELIAMSIADLIAPDEVSRIVPEIARLSSGDVVRSEWRYLHKNGSLFFGEVAVKQLADGRLQAFARDITERKHTEARLHESNRRFSTIFHASPVGKCITRYADGVFLDVNESFAKITGHTCEELLGRSLDELNHWLAPEDRAKLVQALVNNGSVRDWEVGFRRKDGSVGHSLRLLERLTLDGEDCILTVLTDITERTLKEEELRVSRERLETLSRQLIATQESERRHLARELHDEIGQELTSIKLNLKTMEQSLPAGADLIHDTLAIAEQALQQVRSLALDLRPSMLDDIGLVPALRWCLDRQARRSGFTPHFLADPPEIAAAPEVAITCFRVAQESLTNIARHAHARNVRLEVRQHESAIDLQVQDDGIGFDVTAATARAAQGASLGLLGMRERAELVGGLIDIESNPATGTTIHARFPLRRELNDE